MQQNQLSRWGAISRNIPELAPSAKVFLVGDSDDTTYGVANLAADFPSDGDGVVRVYTTIQSAVNAAAGGGGDVVLVSPRHTENFTRADSWNVADVQIIGMGSGDGRPGLTYNDTAATVNLGANGVRVSNLIFMSSVSRVTRALDMDTGFFGQKVDNVLFTTDATGDDFVTSIRMAAKESVIEDFEIRMEANVSGPREGIALLGGDPDKFTIRNGIISGEFDTVSDSGAVAAGAIGFGPISQDTSDTGDTMLDGVIDNVQIINTDTAGAIHIRFGGGIDVSAVQIRDVDVSHHDSSAADSAQFTFSGAVPIGVRIAYDSTTKTLRN